jgi:hypothetical protein
VKSLDVGQRLGEDTGFECGRKVCGHGRQ